MSYKIIGKYIKDLDFSIPSTKTFYMLSKDIVNYKINIEIKSNQLKQNIIEVLTSLNLTPIKDDFEKIKTKIVFATVIELADDKIKKKEIEEIVLIKVPGEIYEELRNIFVSLFENSGFKEVNISKSVNFKKLYEMRKIQ